ncbi:hypothetical protein [Streptomyces sp. YIM 98790]|uniref:hypothetical protein n=1 Tax=Streptomyces sp. YIM 98790 TaxID=2689077 RepID=UPI00140E5F2C|nr:hypothetical protein [Streptomyces sp. YIM 98790]
MKCFIGGHQAVSDEDFIELALGTPPELWLGESDETGEERAARLDAARDIIADDPGLVVRAVRVAVSVVTAPAAGLPPRTTAHRRRSRGRKAVTA